VDKVLISKIGAAREWAVRVLAASEDSLVFCSPVVYAAGILASAVSSSCSWEPFS
jgi:hypothetical protein